jgi:hypothetical protein
MGKIEISREQFEAYEDLVRIKKEVMLGRIYSIIDKLAEDYLVDIDKDEIFEIMRNYDKYQKKFN